MERSGRHTCIVWASSLCNIGASPAHTHSSVRGLLQFLIDGTDPVPKELRFRERVSLASHSHWKLERLSHLQACYRCDMRDCALTVYTHIMQCFKAISRQYRHPNIPVHIENKKAELSQRWPRDAPYGCPEKFRESMTTPTATFPQIFSGLLFQSILWMCVQNLKFVPLPVLEINLGSP